jgi:hypothetical protein
MTGVETTTKEKENNKNGANTSGASKKYVGGNSSLIGKIFDVGSKDAIH